MSIDEIIKKYLAVQGGGLCTLLKSSIVSPQLCSMYQDKIKIELVQQAIVVKVYKIVKGKFRF